ncbi:TPA: hypothetical protein ANIA_11521 [Aspergillus nidulans FGSC A4]|uniref:Uncharacterized protein n=1 Tax=Emericella nidulans (strain FGSC A4 / ATCC 38163 / CBS 112.46 / NRRL 194 / M139) TaxID=227321 RepID=C8V0W4_EMENI|nr:TPA: hypothetical protein ANIA_11521 [Aspergillus nidulans FGSC A4]
MAQQSVLRKKEQKDRGA